jgi:hypothetical protein
MQWIIWAMVIIVLIGIGFSAGFYTSNFLQEQIQVLIGAAVVLAVLTWIGSAIDLLGLLRDWVRQKREERTPILQFEGFVKTSEPFMYRTPPTEYSRDTFFVIVKKTKEEGYEKAVMDFLL